MAANLTFSTTIPAVSFEKVTGGVRVRREGKGDTMFLTRDERSRRLDVYLMIVQGHGVVGRVACIDGEWVIERGIFRNWDYNQGIWQVFPSSTVHTQWYGTSMTDAVAEEALHWLS
jgi:hypothetical protein